MAIEPQSVSGAGSEARALAAATTTERGRPDHRPALPGRPAAVKEPTPLLGALVPAALALAWWLSTDVTHRFSENQLPPIRQLWSAMLDLARSGDYLRHLVASLRRVGIGFAIGASAALVIGVLVGLSRLVERLLDPTLQAMRNIPSLAWVPFLLLWLGIDEVPKVTLIAIGTFFPIYVNLVTGIRQVDRKLVEVGSIFGLSRLGLVLNVFLPAASPYALAGFRIGIGQGWLYLVAAELIASTRGLGFMLIDGQNNMRPDIMLVGILSLAILGKTSDTLLRLVERHALVWTDTYRAERER